MLKVEFDKMKQQLAEDKKSTKKDVGQNEQS
jgi:hypothetical protein